MKVKLFSVQVQSEHDVVAARQRARDIAVLLKFDEQDLTRIATAVSEIVRNAYRYAGGGRVDFAMGDDEGGAALVITVRDNGPGIADAAAILEGRYHSTTGMGLGILGTQRLMDGFHLRSELGGGTTVCMRKNFPRGVGLPDGRTLSALMGQLAALPAVDPVAEVQRQNHELLASLSELKRRQEDLLHLNRELEDTNRGVVALYAELDEKAEHSRQAHDIKTRFLSSVSHEFRTPVNAILGLARMLLSCQDGDLTEEQRNQVSYIRDAADALSDLVNDLLDLARIEAGKTALSLEQFSAEDMLGTLRGMMKPMLTGDAVDFVVHSAGALPLLHTDKGKLAQILRNFLSNAFKFTERGSVVLTAKIPDGGEMVEFTVADTGIGIPAGQLERIFEEFAQLETPLHAKNKGTGLGLALSRRLAGLLGGRVTVQSRPGEGAAFTLAIPRIHAEAIHRSAGKVAHSTQNALVIDDDDISRYMLKRSFPAGFAVVEASDGEEGLKMSRAASFDIIFLDLVMPGLTGYDVLSQLKTDPRTRDVPVVVCTSLAPSEIDMGRIQAANDVLPKAAIAPETVGLLLSQLSR